MTIKDLITRKDKNAAVRTDGEGYPFAEFHREMDRLFDSFFADFSAMPSMGSLMTPASKAFNPRVNVSETEKEIQMTVELPGLDKDDVSVELHADSLIISGEKKEAHEEKDKKWHRIEHSYGSFSRSIPVPAGVDAGSAKADFKKGLLSITMPKLKQDKADRKTIEIKAG